MTNCATTGLEAYVPSADVPWDVGRVQHLFRRIGFGAKPSEIQQALDLGPAETVRLLLDGALQQPQPPEPEWANMDYDAVMALLEGTEMEPFELYVSLGYQHLEDALTYGVREKLSLFWQNHFVTKYESHSCPSYHYQYLKVINEYAFGDFREFVKEITRTPAMLFFLNGFE
ncbi:MAG: DUF1800 family protein, partial [Bacteroidota bacterium]